MKRILAFLLIFGSSSVVCAQSFQRTTDTWQCIATDITEGKEGDPVWGSKMSTEDIAKQDALSSCSSLNKKCQLKSCLKYSGASKRSVNS